MCSANFLFLGIIELWSNALYIGTFPKGEPYFKSVRPVYHLAKVKNRFSVRALAFSEIFKARAVEDIYLKALYTFTHKLQQIEGTNTSKLNKELPAVSAFFNNPQINLLMTAVSYGLMFWALFRTFSRNTYKRYQENRKFLQFFDRLKDREHRYYDCPKCRQVVRVPRGKGKIAITCPKCKERFVKKT